MVGGRRLLVLVAAGLVCIGLARPDLLDLTGLAETMAPLIVLAEVARLLFTGDRAGCLHDQEVPGRTSAAESAGAIGAEEAGAGRSRAASRRARRHRSSQPVQACVRRQGR